MIKSNRYFWALGFAVISAAIAYPCQAEITIESQINVTEANNITTAKSSDIINTAASDRIKTINTSKSFTISETNTLPANSNSLQATPQNQPAVRNNPLGCRFFYTPSMQQ
jgi:hypothetical protein